MNFNIEMKTIMKLTEKWRYAILCVNYSFELSRFKTNWKNLNKEKQRKGGPGRKGRINLKNMYSTMVKDIQDEDWELIL